MNPGERRRIAQVLRRRPLFMLLLTLALPLGNALVLCPSSADWFVALCSDSDARQPLTLRSLEPQHSLLLAKGSELRLAQPPRSTAYLPVAGLPRTSLRPFRLAIDWPLLVRRMAAATLLRMEVRLQV